LPSAERGGEGDQRIVIETRWTEKDQVQEISGARWDARAKMWSLPLSWAACVQLRATFPSTLNVGPRLAEWSWAEFNRRVQPALALRTSLDRAPGYWDERLYDFQTAGSRFLLVASETQAGDPSGGALLGDDMGLGKTAQILATLDELSRVIEVEGVENVLPAAVICPNSVKTGWARQVALWNTGVNPYVVTGGAAARRRILELARVDPRALVIINLESVRLFSRLAPYGSVRLARCRECDPRRGEETLTPARCEVHRKELNAFGFQTVILDEAHRIKDPQSKQTRACWAVGHDPSVLRRWALTGTPIADHIGDLWSILHFMAPHEFPTRTRFIDRYALRAWNPFGGLDIVGINPERREEFFKIVDPRFRRTPKALVLDQLPPIIRSVREVEMVPKQAAAYRELERRLVTRLDNGSVLVSPNNLVNATRLLQLSSSYAEVEWIEAREKKSGQNCWCAGWHGDDCPYAFKIIVRLAEPSPKLDAMEEAYDELGGKPVVIAAMSRQLIELAAKRFEKLKVPHGMITGGVGEFDRQRAIQRFQAREFNVVLMTIGAGGTGVDGLQIADTLFCLQRDWSMINNVQVDARVHRIGSEVHTSVNIVDFVTTGTIESEVQHPRLAAKFERLEEINRDRARLLHAGVTEAELHDLTREESEIIGSFLNT
jgi:SNF2 family DNA or RNA helicase